MKTELSILVPGICLVAIVVALALFPGVGRLADSSLFQSLPYLAIGLPVLLGMLFTQSRVSFASLLLLIIAVLGQRWFFAASDLGRSQTLAAVSVVLWPCAVAVLYRLEERGVFTRRGAARAIGVAGLSLALLLLPQMSALRAAPGEFALFRPMSPYLALPAVALPMLLVTLPFLLLPRRQESPCLGPLLALAILFVFGALNWASEVWSPACRQSAFVLFMSGAGGTLTWAVLESAWRHANVDELTQLPSRRAMRHHFRCLGEDFAVAVVDVDHFKKINDRYGHEVGDQVLRYLGGALARNPAGKAYRMGGEEFVIVAEFLPFDDAVAALEQWRQTLGEREFYLRGQDRPRRKPKEPSTDAKRRAGSLRFTVSIGVVRASRRHSSPQDVLAAADKALYKAKENGRNQLCVGR